MIKRIIVLIIVLLLCNVVYAKRFGIHRCVLDNGTIAFQETKCKKTNTSKVTHKPKIIQPKVIVNSKPIKKQLSKPTYVKPKIVNYKKLANISSNDKSTHLISDRVKSFNISLQGLRKWSLFKKVYNNKLLHIKFLNDKAGEEMSLLIDFIFPDNKKFTENELTELVHLVGSQFTKTSREGTVYPEKMNIRNGNGIMATFTDLNQTSKYKYTTKGAVFKGKWLIQFTMKSMNINSFSHQFAVQNLFSSIKITQ